MHTLHGRVVLLVDDDLREAQQILQFLRLRGASVLGPVRTAAYALEIIRTERVIDYALVDRVLQDGDTYAVADALLLREVPFLFLTGEGDAELAPPYRHIPCRPKPLALPELAEALVTGLEAMRLSVTAQRSG